MALSATLNDGKYQPRAVDLDEVDHVPQSRSITLPSAPPRISASAEAEQPLAAWRRTASRHDEPRRPPRCRRRTSAASPIAAGEERERGAGVVRAHDVEERACIDDPRAWKMPRISRALVNWSAKITASAMPSQRAVPGREAWCRRVRRARRGSPAPNRLAAQRPQIVGCAASRRRRRASASSARTWRARRRRDLDRASASPASSLGAAT